MAQNITSVSPNNNYVSGQSRNTLMSWDDTNPLLAPDIEDPNAVMYGISFRLFNVSSGGSSLGSIGSFSFTYSSSPSGTITFTDAPVLLTMPSGLSAGTYFVAGSTLGTRFSITVQSNAISINFNINNGTGTAPISLSGTPGSSFTMPTSSGFSRNGHSFLGWSSNSSATSASFLANTSYVFNNTTILYAIWQKIVYGITINENGGSLVSDLTYNIQTFSQGFSITRPTPPTGRLFSQYRITTQPSATLTTPFTLNEITIPANTFGNVGIIVDYTAIEYTITYVLDDATGKNNNPTSYTIDTVSSSVNQSSLLKLGHSFAGWFTQYALFGTRVTTIGGGTTGNITLYARWTRDIYYIQFLNLYISKQGTSVIETLQLDYLFTGSDISYSGLTPVKTVESNKRYVFIGFNTSNSATTALTSFGVVGGSNRTFYAIYEQYISGLKINQQNVNIKSGTNQVKAVYVGDTLIWVEYDEN
jgi:uncharacterized repeat protein (TIGR02543 family)